MAMQRELAIILEYDACCFAVTADAIDSAEYLGRNLHPAPGLWGTANSRPVEYIAERMKDHSLIMIPSMDFLVQSVRGTADSSLCAADS